MVFMGTRVNSKKSICPMHSIGNINTNQSMFLKKKPLKINQCLSKPNKSHNI
jgi:hypothetical protein